MSKKADSGISNITGERAQALQTAPTAAGVAADSAATEALCEARWTLHLDYQLCVEVDANGTILSNCAEGALGYILQLISPAHICPRFSVALKVPRLRADTLEENAYVAEILAGEARAVFQANNGLRPDGLIGTVITSHPNFLRNPRALDCHPDEGAKQQHGCVPLLQFGKDHRLRICNVRFDMVDGRPKLRVFPETLADEMSFLRYEDWQTFRSDAQLFEVQSRPFYFVGRTKGSKEDPLSAQASSCGRLSRALDAERPDNVWYAALPSILFRWADGTLQRALGTGAHLSWQPQHHYRLLQQVVQGLQTLHGRGIIHADVRPANVMAIGDLGNPEHYAVSDYGSFTSDQVTAGGASGQSGFTTLPGIARHRASVFYAQERRAGVEREDADVALIIGQSPQPDGTGGEYFIRLGWKAELMDASNNRVCTHVLADMEKAWGGMRARDREAHRAPSLSSGEDVSWRLARGDQIRLRDYVFKLIDTHEEGREIEIDGQRRTVRCLDFRCEAQYTRVLLEKLAARGERYLCSEQASTPPRRPDSVISLDLPRWIELRQSSVATDLYSVGVLAVYTVYTGARLGACRMDARQPSSGDTQPERWVQIDDLEERIAALVRRLEDEKNFRTLWPLLDRACARIEQAVRQFQPASSLLAQADDLPAALDEKRPFKSFRELVERLIEITSGLSKELLDILNYFQNYGHFLLFLHFVISCIHRRSLLTKPHGDATSPKAPLTTESQGAQFPFCADRFEPASKQLITTQVLHRLDQLTEYFVHTAFFEGFHKSLTPDTSGLRTSQSEIHSWTELRTTKEQLEYATREIKQLQTARDENNKLRVEREHLSSRLKELEAQSGDLQSQHDADEQSLRQLEQEGTTLTQYAQHHYQRAINLESALRREDSHLTRIWNLVVAIERESRSKVFGRLSDEHYREIQGLRGERDRLRGEHERLRSNGSEFLGSDGPLHANSDIEH